MAAWESLGGVLTSAPAVCSRGPGRLDVLVRGRDNAFWHRWFDGRWHDWQSIADETTTVPRPGLATVSSREGRLDLITWVLEHSVSFVSLLAGPGDVRELIRRRPGR